MDASARTDPRRWKWTPYDRPEIPDRVTELEGTTDRLVDQVQGMKGWLIGAAMAGWAVVIELGVLIVGGLG